MLRKAVRARQQIVNFTRNLAWECRRNRWRIGSVGSTLFKSYGYMISIHPRHSREQTGAKDRVKIVVRI